MGTWIALSISFLAFVLSVFNFFHSKRTLMTTVVTQQRIEWLENVRTVVAQFISAYLQTDDGNEIREKKMRVELYLNSYNKQHQPLLNAMDMCMANMQNSEKKIEYVNQLILETQKVLNQF